MKLTCLDLEMNQPSGKIIQIGAVIGDTMTGTITQRLRIYINPGEPIDPYITELCGISQDQINQEGIPLADGYRILKDFHQKHSSFINPVTWGGGDSQEIYDQLDEDSRKDWCFGRRWIDVKTWYTYLMLTRGKAPSGGLASAMGYFKLHFKGKAHRADVDAANTLALFFKLLERQAKLESILDSAKNV